MSRPMSQRNESLLRHLVRNQSGMSLIWATLLIPLILGMGGLTVDAGYGYTCYRQLQNSTEAAALAAASALPNTTLASTNATKFSAVSGNYNAYPQLNTPSAITGAQITITPGCITITGLPQCGASITANAVKITQTATIPTFFIKALSVFGLKSASSIKLSATSIAVMRGAQRGPYDVAIVLDTTASMQSADGGSNCTGTKIQCAEEGAQILLAQFSPCLPDTTCGAATNGNVAYPVDEVALFTFPAQSPGTQVSKDEACSSSQPTPVAYPDTTTLTALPITTAHLNTLVSDYQVVPLLSNYRASDSTTGSNPLTIGSSVSASNPSLVNAVAGNSYFGGSSCTGMQAKGGEQTYYAGAIFTAQQYLAANGRSNAQNVIILLGDGDANGGAMAGSSSTLNNNSSIPATYGKYPSSYRQCQQAIDMATAAKTAGTKVYTVGYGVASGGCSTDSGVSACSALRQMASSDSNFFVDTSSTACAGATSVTMNGKTNSLSAIFTAIVGDLTLPRLVPNTIAFTAN